MLYTAVEEAPSDESVEPEVISRHFASFDEVFFTFCDRELKKINTFYSGESISSTKAIDLVIFLWTIMLAVHLLQKNWQKQPVNMQLCKVN